MVLTVHLAGSSGWIKSWLFAHRPRHRPLSVTEEQPQSTAALVSTMLEDIRKITGGNFAHVFDVSAEGHDLAVAALETVSILEEKWFSTVNDWISWEMPSTIHKYHTKLGELGKNSPIGIHVTEKTTSWIPVFERHIAGGALRPLEYQIVDGQGWEAVVEAAKLFGAGKAVKKLVVIVRPE